MMTTKIGVQAAADYLNGAFQTGWIPGEQEDLSSPTLKKPVTVEYVAANQIKIVGLVWTDRIQKGTKIRYKQGGEYKYDFVSTITANTDTTLTLSGRSTVENEAITEFWFSNIANPIGWPFGVDYIQGENENGSWRKWVDGTQECWGNKTFTSLSMSSTETIYYNNTPSLVFAVEFYVEPIANIWVEELSSGTTWTASGGATIISTTGIDNIYIARATDSLIDNLTLGYHAKGRWKE